MPSALDKRRVAASQQWVCGVCGEKILPEFVITANGVAACAPCAQPRKNTRVYTS